MNPLLSWRRPLSSFAYLAGIALFITFADNYRFYHELLKVYPFKLSSWLFLASVGASVFLVIFASLCFLSLFISLRIAACALLLIASVSGHFSDHFGVIIDTQMIRNTVQTDIGEARDLITVPFTVRILLLGVLPCIAAVKVPVSARPLVRQRLVCALGVACSLILLAGNALAFSSHYASFLREHKALRFYINPVTALVSAAVFVREEAFPQPEIPFSQVANDAAIAEADEGHELVIMVVGETARADRFSLNGYLRPTNPLLSQIDNVVSFTAVSSCGTSTAVSVPCMFSTDDRAGFNLQQEAHHENVLDILQRVGVTVLWRDNNSSAKGVADRIRYEDYRSPEKNPVCDEECRDVGMLDGLQTFIDQQNGDILIVLHQMGNHGPAYYKRYPAEFEVFTPACHSATLSDCSEAEINNAYDNAIRYTDYFLAQVIHFLQRNTPQFETTMLYVSDHGESLGEGGLYLHGAPYFMAPEAQVHVPVILWQGDPTEINWSMTIRNKDIQRSHDAVFSSLLELFEVDSRELHERQPFFARRET